ncbi:Steroidogenic acute regulatory [Entamoeba marina]
MSGNGVQLNKLKKRIDDMKNEFLNELSTKEKWVECKGNDHAQLFYKNDKKSPIKKFKISAVIPSPLDTVLDALLVPQNRVSWEILVNSMKNIEDFGDGYTMHYITTKPLAGGIFSGRDFVHFRKIFDGLEKTKPNETSSKIVVDISCDHPDYPPNKKYTRATTLFCATYFREYDVNGSKITSYESITQTDINGWIPSFFVNTASKHSTLEWYEKLETKATELQKQQQQRVI